MTALLLVCSHTVSAEDLMLKDGSLLRDAIVSRKGIDHVIIRHAGGVKRVDYHELTIDLQDRYAMSEKEVKERLAQQQAKAQAAADQLDRKKDRHILLLKDAQNMPRYLSSGDVRRLFLFYDDISEVAAEYLAAEWNKRESLRLKLPDQVQRYEKYADLVRETFDKERAESLRERSRERQQLNELRVLKQELKLAKRQAENWQKLEERYKERLEESEKEYRELWRDYERERNANRIRFTPGVPIYIPSQRRIR